MNNTNTIDKDAMREKFEDKFSYMELMKEKDSWGNDVYKHSHIEAMWFGYQAAYVSCLSEFEQIGTVDCSDVNDNSTEFWGELDGSMNYALGTPLFTRKV